MDSNEVEIKKSTTELKHLGFLKKIAMKFLAVLSNLYDFVKENTGDLKTTVVSAENAVVSAVGPVYEKLKDLCERIIVFVDDKFDKYAPSLAKNLVSITESLIHKAKPLVKLPLTAIKSVIKPVAKPLITTTSNLLYKLLQTTKSIPLVGKTQTLITNTLSTTTSLFTDTILQKGPGLGTRALNTTNSLADKNPLLSAVNSATQDFVKEAQATSTKATLQAAYVQFKVVGIPVLIQFWYKVNQYPLVNALSVYILPVVEYVSESYNKAVKYMEGKGYSVFGYLPVIPVDEIKTAYKVYKTSKDGLAALGDLFGLNK